ncbi:MAG: sulfite exporter TauE/SafE family protein [Acidobacteriota bacterium]
MEQAGLALLGTTVATAAVHALIPDHWLPLVLLARAQRWELRRTLGVAAFSGTLHSIVSVSLGAMALWLGREAALEVGEKLQHLTSLLLVLFGAVYAGWALARGGHSLHMHPHLADPHGEPDQRLSGMGLGFIIGFNPCVLIIPILFATAAWRAAWQLAVAGAFTLTTIATTSVMAWVGLRSSRRLEFAFLDRFGEVLSGALIALTGLAMWLLEVL